MSETLHALSALRSAAQADALHPRGIELPWLLRIQSTASRSQAIKLHMAYQALGLERELRHERRAKTPDHRFSIEAVGALANEMTVPGLFRQISCARRFST